MSIPVLESHAGDGALVRFLDGVSDPGEHRAVESHLAACEGCAGRLRVLRRRSAGLSALLDQTAPAVPPFVPRQPARTAARPVLRQTPWLRAAAIAALVAGVGVASPLRAWVVEWARQGWALIGDAAGPGGQESPATPAPPPPLAVDRATRVRFPATAGTLQLEVAPHPGGGELIFARHAADEVEVEVVRGGDVLVLPDGVRITAGEAGSGQYRVSLPARVRSVTVSLPGGERVRLRADELDEGGGRVVRFGPAG